MIPVLFLRRFFKYSPLDLLQGVLYNREKPIRATSAPSARTASEREIGTTTASPHPPRRRLSMSRPRSNGFFH